MPQIKFNPSIVIELLPNSRTNTPSELRLQSFTPDITGHRLALRWQRITYDLSGAVLLTEDASQVADSTTAVILPKSGEEPIMMQLSELRDKFITPATYDDEGKQLTPEVDNTPPWMTEIDFWWYVMQNQPQPIIDALHGAGERFAKRNGWL